MSYLLDERAQIDCCEGGLFGGLQHDRAASSERWAELASRQTEREVPLKYEMYNLIDYD